MYDSGQNGGALKCKLCSSPVCHKPLGTTTRRGSEKH